MRKLLILLVVIYAVFFLSQKNMLPSMAQIKNVVNQFISQPVQPQQGTNQKTVNIPSAAQSNTSSIPAVSSGKYPAKTIQTYRVGIMNNKLVVAGKPTPYGQFYHADGIILYIEEPRANKKVTIKVPYINGTVHYEYPLSYMVGDVVVNLDEYYNGKANDPNKVLGYAQYHLTDGDPYLLPSYMVQSDNPTIKALAQTITNGMRTDTEKSRAIFEWVAKNISYNAPLVNAKNPPLYSALQTYESRDVLCSGYADLSAALHRAVGIEAKVDYGENHAWNEIKLNGVWQSEDPTYGSGFINLNTNQFVRSYHPAYFAKTDKHKEGEYPW